MENANEIRRIRLIFEDPNMLNKNQRAEGLKHCWMYLKPHLQTIGDVAVDISFTFQLHRSCPHGLLLSMEGFTLPCSQPTCILKDKDIVSVNRKKDRSEKTIIAEEAVNSIKGSDSLEGEHPLTGGVKLLAIEEFEKEAGGYQSEHEDYGTDSKDADGSQNEKHSVYEEHLRRKRKQLEFPMGLMNNHDTNKDHEAQAKVKNGGVKKKRKICNNTQVGGRNNQSAVINVANKKPVKQIKSPISHKLKSHKKAKDKKAKRSTSKKELEFVGGDRKSKESSDRDHDQGMVTSPVVEISKPHELEKHPSRSARRKKAKRRWLREQKAKKEEEIQKNALLDEKNSSKCEKPRDPSQINECEGTLPVIVRPGHIRFVPLEDEQEVGEDRSKSLPTFQWKGITNKRQGQNWGKQKNGLRNVKRSYTPSENDDGILDISAEETSKGCSIIFDELPNIHGLPQQDDVIAYRIVELSSSWCPELSNYRVGKVEHFDKQSSRVRLVPVKKYPFLPNGLLDEGETVGKTGCSIYNDDGSLEIDFSSLVDVRLVNSQKTSHEKHSASAATTEIPPPTTLHVPYDQQTGTVTCEKKDLQSSTDIKTTQLDSEANVDGSSPWQEIEEVSNAKKAELALKRNKAKSVEITEEDCSKKSKSKPGKGTIDASDDMSKKQRSVVMGSRPYHLSRRSAVGPIMSLLREQNILGS